VILTLIILSKIHAVYKFLKQTLDPYNVTQIINLPTRTTSNTSTIIDHIYVSHSLVSPEVYVEDVEGLFLLLQLLAPQDPMDRIPGQF
jgi:hypothetical protein